MFIGMLPIFRVRGRRASATASRCCPRRAVIGLLLVSSPLVGCTKDPPPPPAATGQPAVAPITAPADSALPTVVARWSEVDGSAIYVPGNGGVAQVILPPVLDDSVPSPTAAILPATAAPASVDLFAPSGRTATASLGAYTASSQPEVGQGCDAWPVVPLRDAANVTPQSWRIALQSGVAEALRTDSLGAMPRSDSAQLVVEINRAAAQLPLDSAGVLRRVPFSVSKAYRMQFVGNVDAVIAVVERRLNMEASPRVERTILVLERPPKVKRFSAVWRDTQYATEDDLIAVDLLAVVRLHGTSRPTVFLGLDFGDGSRVQMLQRTEGGIWSLKWSSAYTGC
jgi:hypothetical protein